jgi:tRNA 2-selenouridine synthase
VPDALLAAMRGSPCIRLEVPRDVRIRLLRDEYAHFEANPIALMTQLECLVALLGRERINRWKALAESKDWDQMVEQLLLEHYDPAYEKSIARNFKRVDSARVVPIVSDVATAYAAAADALLA